MDSGVEELLAGGRLRGRHAVRLQALRLVDARREEGRALEEKKRVLPLYLTSVVYCCQGGGRGKRCPVIYLQLVMIL